MLRSQQLKNLTAREKEEMAFEREMTDKKLSYNERVAKMNLEITKQEAKWNPLLKLPLALIYLPIKLVMALAVPISIISKKELPEAFWDFMKS